MKFLRFLAVGLMMSAAAAFAGTAATGNNVKPTLQVTANVQSAVSLTLSTGTAAVSHCPVAGGSTTDYKMDFGTVDALGVNAGACNKFNPAVPGTDSAIYWSDYQLTPIFTSQTAFSGTTISAWVSTDFNAPHNIFIVRDNSATVPAGAGSFAAMSIAQATPDTVAAAGSVSSGTALTRYIGIAVKPDNGAVLQGAQTATVTFTMTVQ